MQYLFDLCIVQSYLYIDFHGSYLFFYSRRTYPRSRSKPKTLVLFSNSFAGATVDVNNVLVGCYKVTRQSTRLLIGRNATTSSAQVIDTGLWLADALHLQGRNPAQPFFKFLIPSISCCSNNLSFILFMLMTQYLW